MLKFQNKQNESFISIFSFKRHFVLMFCYLKLEWKSMAFCPWKMILSYPRWLNFLFFLQSKTKFSFLNEIKYGFGWFGNTRKWSRIFLCAVIKWLHLSKVCVDIAFFFHWTTDSSTFSFGKAVKEENVMRTLYYVQKWDKKIHFYQEKIKQNVSRWKFYFLWQNITDWW